MKRHVLLTDEEIALLTKAPKNPDLVDLKKIVDRATRPNTEEEADYIRRARADYEEESRLEFDDTPSSPTPRK